MSLIKCPECNQEVSSKAPLCPHCGVKIADNVKRCPVCGAFLLMDAEQCPKCNTKFVVGKTNEPDGEELTQNEDVEVVENAGDVVIEEKSGTMDETLSSSDTPKKKSGVPWWLLVLCILVIAVGGFFYWEKQNRERAEEAAYSRLQDCTNPLSYEDFIARFPKSRHIEDVKTQLQNLYRVDKMWADVASSKDVVRLQQFVEENPHSAYKQDALRIIDSLDWLEANRIGKSVAYDAYIRKHENGEFVTQAFTARDNAKRREEQALRDSLAQADSAVAVVPAPQAQ